LLTLRGNPLLKPPGLFGSAASPRPGRRRTMMDASVVVFFVEALVVVWVLVEVLLWLFFLLR